MLQLIAEERRTKEVAALLNIAAKAVKTIDFHMLCMMDQLELHSTVALAQHAIAEWLVRL